MLLLTGSVSRLSGGLFHSVRGLAQTLSEIGEVDIGVVGYPDRHTSADIQQWLPVEPFVVPYGWSGHARRELKEVLTTFAPDVIHVQYVWSPAGLFARRWADDEGVARIVSPRGMLDPWSLRVSRTKKRVAWHLYERRNLRSARCVHALNEGEALDVRRRLPDVTVAVVPNAVTRPQSTEKPGRTKRSARRTLLYLGRLTTKKNVEGTLRAFARARREDRSAREWDLRIVGSGDPAYVGALRSLVLELGLEGCVRFDGTLLGSEKRAAFEDADAFVLASFGEGQPMAVLEAMSHSLPVIVTPACNIRWKSGEDAGFCVEPTEEALSEALRRLTNAPRVELAEMGEAGSHLVAEQFGWGNVGRSMTELYMWAAGRGPKPEHVSEARRS